MLWRFSSYSETVWESAWLSNFLFMLLLVHFPFGLITLIQQPLRNFIAALLNSIKWYFEHLHYLSIIAWFHPGNHFEETLESHYTEWWRDLTDWQCSIFSSVRQTVDDLLRRWGDISSSSSSSSSSVTRRCTTSWWVWPSRQVTGCRWGCWWPTSSSASPPTSPCCSLSSSTSQYNPVACLKLLNLPEQPL